MSEMDLELAALIDADTVNTKLAKPRGALHHLLADLRPVD